MFLQWNNNENPLCISIFYEIPDQFKDFQIYLIYLHVKLKSTNYSNGISVREKKHLMY